MRPILHVGSVGQQKNAARTAVAADSGVIVAMISGAPTERCIFIFQHGARETDGHPASRDHPETRPEPAPVRRPVYRSHSGFTPLAAPSTIALAPSTYETPLDDENTGSEAAGQFFFT